MLDAIVYIGRFQPLTLSHIKIIKKALESAKKVIVIVGSAKNARNTHDPWTEDERIEMLKSVRQINTNRICFAPLQNSNYEFSWWLSEVQKIVEGNTVQNSKIGIIGYKKDETGYYLDYFPQWEFIEISHLYDRGLSATQIREKLFCGNDLDGTPDEVCLWLNDWIISNRDIYENLKGEFFYIKDYKKMWAASPFAPVFVTADALVLCKKNILLIQRKNNPGKNLYALPGGFLEQRESLADCAVRELKEETQIVVDISTLKNSISLTKVFDDPFRDLRGRFITHAHVFNLNLENLPKIESSDDAGNVLWLPLSELDEFQNKFFSDHYRIINNLLKALNIKK
ncbi:MAG: bifunctional nicotinamide-nucleotide adenylyltransferase/Nudix hydroxylase [Endomicrobium sp.]|jgi:bifunctional NMN adenylyltransferase/nudix hydrolase|nr:bifunctional nicotinamide-nucleotide adenylyltransferase/Nudix hydroxylase [Endomicrobium sp.]